jgi:hypothetical protein
LVCAAPLRRLFFTLTPQQSHPIPSQLWDDAEDSSGSDILIAAMQVLPAVAETGWSAQAVVRGNAPDGGRWTDARCRLASRFVTSHPAPYSAIGQFCTVEYQGLPAPWDA